MPLGGLVTAGLVTAGAGLVSNIFGGVKAGKEAKKMDALAKTVPQYQKSKAPGLMIGQAQMELNANPMQASQNRMIQSTMANQMANAQMNATDPSMLLQLTNAYAANAEDSAFKNDQMNAQMRMQKLQDYYNSLGADNQEDRFVADANMTAFNSKANLMNAAGQTRVGAIQNIGNSLIGAGSSMITAGMKK